MACPVVAPLQGKEFALAAAGQEQKPDHVCLLPAALPDLPIRNIVEAGDFLAGQEPRERRSAVNLQAPRRIDADVSAGDGEVHDLAKSGETMVGVAGSCPAECIEPPTDLCPGDAVERPRPERRQKPAVQKSGYGSAARRLVAVEVGH